MNRIGQKDTRTGNCDKYSVFYCRNNGNNTCTPKEVPVWAKGAHHAKLVADKWIADRIREEMAALKSPVSYMFVVSVPGDGSNLIV